MEIKMPIKQLVEFILRSGSIDSRFTGSDRALLGSKIHRKLQKNAGEGYKSEVSLQINICQGDIIYTIYGRADGVITKNGGIAIDEIKTISSPIEMVDEHYSLAHWAQAKCYGYIVCVQNRLSEIEIQLTYYNIDTDEIKVINKNFTVDTLENDLRILLQSYEKWAVFSANWAEKRTLSLKQLTFPFPEYRKGQRALAVASYKSIRDANRLFACAPTGIGKTMSVVFPSLKAMGENYIDKVFYLTAKTVTGISAKNSIELLMNSCQALELKSIFITAKDKMCFLEQRQCNPEACPYANGYFDRINDVLFETIQQNNVLDRNFIEKIARENNLCPYELSLDISTWCDFIVCDYNYLFDPTVHLQRFFETSKGNYAFLIDEAHNLPDRAREMYSADLDKKSFFEYKKQMDKKFKKLSKVLNEINNMFIELRHRFDEGDENQIVDKNFPEIIEKKLNAFVNVCSEHFDGHKNEPTDDELLNLYFSVKFFLRIMEEYDDTYVCILSKYQDNVKIKLYCVDPSEKIDNSLQKGRSSIIFSATITPMDYYKQLMGKSGECLNIPSPFLKSNMKLLIADNISTKYNDRPKTVDEISQFLFSVISAKRGNYIAYFPSYAYMKMVYDDFSAKFEECETIIQDKNMDDAQREAFIESFDETNTDGLLGFCVMGGIYGEGIDLTGERLIGCIIVGVGLPQINTQLDVLKNYYDNLGSDGFSYAYQYPGMNKVMQAAGRVIRTDEDKGVILLIDQRFTTARYKKIMPAHWSDFKIVKDCNMVSDELQDFWNKI